MTPIAIQNAATGAGNGYALDAVLLGAFAVEFRILDLEAPEPGYQKEERDHCGVLEDGDLTRRKARVVAQRWLIG